MAQNLIQNEVVVLESLDVAIDQANLNLLPKVRVLMLWHQAPNKQATTMSRAISSVSILTRKTHRRSFHRQTYLPRLHQLNRLPKQKKLTNHLSQRNRANPTLESSWQNLSRPLGPTMAVG